MEADESHLTEAVELGKGGDRNRPGLKSEGHMKQAVHR